MGSFEVCRADVAKNRMMTLAIVESFDVEEDVGLRFLTRAVGSMFNQLRQKVPCIIPKDGPIQCNRECAKPSIVNGCKSRYQTMEKELDC